MRISIFSDLHFGFAWNSKIENDSFENTKEAIEKSLDSDLILICGDIFDTRFPKTDVWARALKVLSKPLLAKNSGIELVKTIDKDLEEISGRSLRGIPIIALHGTHERLGKGQLNAVEVLELTGFLLHLHCNGLVFKKGRQKVAIQGMSGVPERYAKKVLDRWNPQPIKGCYNILLLHQSIEPYVYSPLDPPTLNLSNLPEGFDLIIDGHVHQSKIEKLDTTTLLLTGSTITTQYKKEESGSPKGLYKLKLPEKKIDFIELEKARKFFYEEITLSEEKSMREEILEKVNSILQKKLSKPPIIRLKIISKRKEILDKELKKIEEEFRDKAILRFVRQVESPEITEKLEFLRKAREERVSIEEIGMKLLHENLEKLKFSKTFDIDHLFNMLSEGDVERAFEILVGEQKTITTWVKK